MAKKLKWKRTRDGIVFIEKKPLRQRFRSLGFMQVSVTTFCLAVLLTAAALAASTICKGAAPVWIGYLPAAALILSLIGYGVTRYGHFTVRAKSRIPWRFGIYSNGLAAFVLIVLYIWGLIH